LNLNETEVRETFDAAIHKGYMLARQRVATMASSVIKTNSSTSSTVEDDITHVLDQLYETWIVKVCIVVVYFSQIFQIFLFYFGKK